MNEIILFLNEKGSSRRSGWRARSFLCACRGSSLHPGQQQKQTDLLIGHQLGPFGGASPSVQDSPLRSRAWTPGALFVSQPAALLFLLLGFSSQVGLIPRAPLEPRAVAAGRALFLPLSHVSAAPHLSAAQCAPSAAPHFHSQSGRQAKVNNPLFANELHFLDLLLLTCTLERAHQCEASTKPSHQFLSL